MNVFDYVEWRGDLSFDNDPFNEVDALILAQLSYIPLENTVPESFGTSVSIANVPTMLDIESLPDNKKLYNFEQDIQLLNKLAASERFGNVRLTGCLSRTDPLRKFQFAAVTCFTKNFIYTAFRGTDGSIAGWHENFNFSIMNVTPSQMLAIEYLNKNFSGTPSEIILGGHSKGGNIAVYSAAFCSDSVRDKIKNIYAFDSPGFREEITDNNTFAETSKKVISFIPQSSLVGQLLNSAAEHRIVRSSANGIKQHAAYSWQVKCTRFECVEELSRTGKFINKTMSNWLAALDDSDRQNLVEAIFDVINASNTESFQELSRTKRKSYGAILKALAKLSPEQQAAAKKAIYQLAADGKNSLMSNFTL